MDIIMDALIDTLKLFPFLFLVYLLLEFIEHNFSEKWANRIQKSSRFGPIWASILGIFPQCGFASMVSSLYATKVITIGTLMAVFLATSDEMLPILISNQADPALIGQILLIKVVVGMVAGFAIDFVYRKRKQKQDINIAYLCKKDECGCERGIVRSALIHSIKVTVYIGVITLLLNVALSYIDLEEILSNGAYSVWLASLIGLIPNCGASIVLTELYLEGVLEFSPLIAGLLTNSGVGILILFKLNKNLKENLLVLFMLFIIGGTVGYLIYFVA